MRISRRDFVKSATASGIALSITPLAIAEEPNFAARETLPGRQGWNPAATGVGRIDGVAKVTGAKLYASDFRAADLPNWPQATSHAMLIRAADATHVYDGLDLSRLSGALKPAVVVTAADLARAGMRVPEFYAGDLLCPVGKTPLYLGQPVALLIFEDFDAFDQARLALRDATLLKFGKETGPVTMANYCAFRFTRVGGPTPDAPDVYSPVKNGWVSPERFENTGRPIWARLPIPTGQAYAEAATYGEKIRAELAGNNPALLVLDREFETQSVDPMALEPEGGLAWYDARRKNLELVVSVQSPYEAAGALAYLLGNAQTAFKPARINTNFAYCGGGFGGRDHTPFPLYVALVAMFFPDRPVRLANNRFEQFQSGIKRHAFKFRTRIGVDRATGKMVGFAADHALDGGGLANFSADVATVGANTALGIYYVPKVDVTTYAFHSRGVTAGSMRGFGTLQTMTALEAMVDEICTALPLDPIEFRRRNALAPGGRTMAGNTYSVSIRTPEILDKLEKHPIWKRRADEKARGQQAGILVGTGVACATKNYGTGGDCALGSVEIAPDGRIAIYCDGVEMGNGIGTAAANRVAAHLGAVADEIALAQVDTFGPLALVTSGDSHTESEDAGRGGAQSALGACDQFSYRRLDRRAGRDTRGSRGRARRVPLRSVAGGARIVGHCAERSQGQPMGDGALEGRATGHGGAGANALVGGRGKGACAQWRDRGNGARLQSLGMVASDLHGGQTGVDGRHRCARRAPWRGQICSHRSFQREISAYQPQPERTHLYGVVRHGGPHRDRSRSRRVAYRKSVQRAGMRPGVGPRGRAGTGAGRLRDGCWLCVARVAAALRGWTGQREMEPRSIPRRTGVGSAAQRARG
jgi:CO/xanthine dehydrogenase Mo-binding subunit